MPVTAASPGSKHGPNRLRNYFQVHENYIRQYVARGFLLSPEGLEVQSSGGTIVIEGALQCLGGIQIGVGKTITILDDSDDPLLVTESYRYNVSVKTEGTVFRYCSPHDGHRSEHHVHRIDVFGDSEETVELIFNEDDRPTLGDVITEASDWYYANLKHFV